MREMKLIEIAKAEHGLVSNAPQENGKYFQHTQFAIDLLNTFIRSVNPNGAFFMTFFATVEKHIILAALSALRLHHVQANFDIRYATEAGAWAAFAMAHKNTKDFVRQEPDGSIEATKEAKEKMYKWLEEKYSAGSVALKGFKGVVNKLSTHANIIDAHRNFGEFTEEKMSIFFFDDPQEHIVKTDLWTVGNLAMGLLDLFYGVNKDYSVLVLQDDFMVRFRKLKLQNDELKKEMMNHPRVKPFV